MLICVISILFTALIFILQILFQATSPQTGGNLKSMKEKSNQSEKEVQEASGLKTAGPEGEITAGLTGHSVFFFFFELGIRDWKSRT